MGVNNSTSRTPDVLLDGDVRVRDLSCTIETSFERLEHLRELWDEFTEKAGGSIYMSFDWCQTWWRFYGRRNALRIYIARSGKQIVGILPLYIDRMGVYPLRFRVAKLVGANIPPKVFAPALLPEYAYAIFRIVLSHLLKTERCDVLSIGPVSKFFPSGPILRSVVENEFAESSVFVEQPRDVYTVFELPDDYLSYLRSLSRNERKQYNYKLRALQKEHNISVRVVNSTSEASTAYEMFLQMHTRQWNEEGRPGHFKAWPQADEYNRELVQKQALRGRVRFLLLQSDETVIAAQFGFRFGNTYYWELPARATGPQWERLSLGRTALCLLFEEVIAEGMRTIQAGLGHYKYKRGLGGKEISVQYLRVVSRSMMSRIKWFCFRMIGSIIQLSYHKVWYRRIQPHLPKGFQWPIWRFSIRLDF